MGIFHFVDPPPRAKIQTRFALTDGAAVALRAVRGPSVGPVRSLHRVARLRCRAQGGGDGKPWCWNPRPDSGREHFGFSINNSCVRPAPKPPTQPDSSEERPQPVYRRAKSRTTRVWRNRGDNLARDCKFTRVSTKAFASPASREHCTPIGSPRTERVPNLFRPHYREHCHSSHVNSQRIGEQYWPSRSATTRGLGTPLLARHQ